VGSPVQLAWQTEPDLPIRDGITGGVLAFCKPCGWRTFVGLGGRKHDEEAATAALDRHRDRCPVRQALAGEEVG
jgi:hypothetical protein